MTIDLSNLKKVENLYQICQMKNNSSSPAIILKKYRYDQELMRDCERVPYVIRGGKYEWSVDIRSVTIADYLITFPCWGEMLLDQNIKGGRNLNYIYIVECKEGTYYTGWTNNLEKRIKDHNNGKGAKYIKSIVIYSSELW